MSRTARIIRWTLPLAVLIFLAMESAFIYLFVMNLRINRELASGRWREPTVIFSAAAKQPREIARLYGTDWRPSPPALLKTLPRHVGEAFLAAEDVRFRRHFGIDPIPKWRRNRTSSAARNASPTCRGSVFSRAGGEGRQSVP